MPDRLALMPWPASITRSEGRLTLPSPIRVFAPDELASLFRTRLHQAIGNDSIQTDRDANILFERSDALTSEAYRLTITNTAKIEAGTPEGWLRGSETLLQLVSGQELPRLEIEDRPRFPWRGLLIDPARHFLPVEVVKRLLDCMAAVKLNVLHWHLSDDQGFRVESFRFPRLHELGSDGQFYRHSEIAEVVEHAARRGIRVVPEFDVPGHTTSWLVGYPSLGSRPGDEEAGQSSRYTIERSWGPSHVALDPTREEIFAFLEEFLNEMCAIFPDECFHIGGDEVLSVAWNSNPRIVAWMRDRGMTHTRDLQAYFSHRVCAILEKCGRRMVGWDEILHPNLPASVIVQSWRGQKFLADALRRHQAILSSGYYLDQLLPASYHYLVDPHESAELSVEEKSRVLGGEACVWGEYIGPDNFDSRIWPRLCAVAERLWSSPEQRDIEDMYARLQGVSAHLERLGSRHRIQVLETLARLNRGESIDSLLTLAEVVEPVKFYDRATARLDSSLTPLTRLVDAVAPESNVARLFSKRVAEFCAAGAPAEQRAEIAGFLEHWRDHRQTLARIIQNSPPLGEIEPISRNLAQAARLGLEALERVDGKNAGGDRWWIRSVSSLERAKAPRAELVLVVLPAIRQLVDFARRSGR